MRYSDNRKRTCRQVLNHTDNRKRNYRQVIRCTDNRKRNCRHIMCSNKLCTAHVFSQKRWISKTTTHKRRAHSKIGHTNADATSHQIGTLEQMLTTGNQVSTPRSAQTQHLKSKRLCESTCARAICIALIVETVLWKIYDSILTCLWICMCIYMYIYI